MAESGTGKGTRCSICGKPIKPSYRPFCSRRCQQVDLGRWLNENYRIGGESDPNGVDADSGDGSDE